jgi:hypothetical protein
VRRLERKFATRGSAGYGDGDVVRGELHDEPCDAWLELIVHIIVINNAIVITFSPHKLANAGLIALITNEAIEVGSFWDGIDAVLAIGRAVVP